jgi:Zn-dependent metalloprotease
MLRRHVTWILITVLLLSACGRNVATQSEGTPVPDSADGSNQTANSFPMSFEGAIELKRESNGSISLLKGDNLSIGIESRQSYQYLLEAQSFAAMAIEFVQSFKEEFRLENPKSELAVLRAQEDDLGFHQVRLAQNYKSVPILYSELIVHFDREDHVYLVQGQYIPTPIDINLTPEMNLDAVVKSIKGQGEVSPSSTGTLILSLSGEPPRLVYQIRLQVSLTDQSILIVDANTAEVIRKVPTIYNAN